MSPVSTVQIRQRILHLWFQAAHGAFDDDMKSDVRDCRLSNRVPASPSGRPATAAPPRPRRATEA